MEIYKGTVWASWDKDAPDLMTYLGDAKVHLDLALDCRDGREGGSEVLFGVHKWIIPCNWKFAAENFLGDTYHNVSHRSVDMIGIGPSAPKRARRAGATTSWRRRSTSGSTSPPATACTAPSCRRPGSSWTPTRTTRSSPSTSARRTPSARSGWAPNAHRLVPFVGTIYPNVSFHGNQPRNLCVWHPHGPESTEAWRFFLVDADAPQEVKDFLRVYYMRYSGPAGMTEQDDMENWNYATAGSRGVIARRYPFNYQQSLGKVQTDGPVAGQREPAGQRREPAPVLPPLARLHERRRLGHAARAARTRRPRAWPPERWASSSSPAAPSASASPSPSNWPAAATRSSPSASPSRRSPAPRKASTALRAELRARGLQGRRARSRRVRSRPTCSAWSTTPSRATARSTAWSTTRRSGRWAPCSTPTKRRFDRILDVNLKGTYLASRAVLPHMIRAGGGSIVNIGSGAGYGKPNMAAYSASKGAIVALSDGDGLRPFP